MIPQTVHYCWFGKAKLPKSAIKYIHSWKKYFPDYEIKEWNESNYDVRKIPYIAEAYDAKKYAFVSDYARFDILYENGGVYFDTDVEVIKPFDDILTQGPFMGCQIDGGEKSIYVAPGLGIAAESGMEIYRDILDFYSTQHFLNEDGSYNTETIGTKITNFLQDKGMRNVEGIQEIAGIMIYPGEYFNPLQDSTGVLKITDNTHSIHWYSKTWMTPIAKIRSKLTRPFHRMFGDDCFKRFKDLLKK